MRKVFLALLPVLCCTAQAQDIIVGDMNDDGNLSVADVTSLVSTISGVTPMRKISAMFESNESIVGTWTSLSGAVSFGEDGTIAYPDAATYKYLPMQSNIVLFDALENVVGELKLVWRTEEYIVLRKEGTATYTKYYKGSPVSGITLSQTSIQGELGKTYQLTATLSPSNVAFSEIQWSSSDESVAKVSADGLVTVVGGGTATITASATDGSGVKSTCTISIPKLVSSITLDKTTLTLDLDDTFTLTATILPADATNKTVTWSSSDDEVVYVNKSGRIVAFDYGTATITCSSSDGSGVVGTCVVTVAKPHEYVDLGLPSGTLWATCNIGADKPEDYGLYFAWGETTGYTSNTSDGRQFNWANYSLCNGSSSKMTKYSTSTSYWDSSLGTSPDGKTEVDLEDDAAHVNWGGNWRMPSRAQQDELRNNCTWSWTTLNGVNGYNVRGTNGNSIFLPAAGYRSGSGFFVAGSYGYYWSRSLFASDVAYNLYFYSDYVTWGGDKRYMGQSVRAVCSK